MSSFPASSSTASVSHSEETNRYDSAIEAPKLFTNPTCRTCKFSCNNTLTRTESCFQPSSPQMLPASSCWLFSFSSLNRSKARSAVHPQTYTEKIKTNVEKSTWKNGDVLRRHFQMRDSPEATAPSRSGSTGSHTLCSGPGKSDHM